MGGLQIAALIFAILLLLPGGCFLFFGVVILPPLVLIAAVILGLAGWLFWFALGRTPPAAGEPPPPLDRTAFPLTAERARRELGLRNYRVKRFLFAKRWDVVTPSGEQREFPDEAAFLEWATRELG